MEFNSGLSKGSSDDWDSIINFEGKAFEDGVIEGRSDAIESREMLENGIHSGFMKGTFQVSSATDYLFTAYFNWTIVQLWVSN